MPIYFRNAPVREPFIYDSIGNHWLQDATSRPNGYPFYHYLQTESGCGRITIQGKSYLLHEQEGVLIAPSIRHSYLAQTPALLVRRQQHNDFQAAIALEFEPDQEGQEAGLILTQNERFSFLLLKDRWEGENWIACFRIVNGEREIGRASCRERVFRAV